MTQHTRTEQEVDLGVLWRGVRRRLGWLIGAALMLGLATYFWSRSQPAIYAARATLLSAGNQGADAAFGNAVIRAPILPEGALQQALKSTSVIEPIVANLKGRADLPGAERAQITAALQQQLASQTLSSLHLGSEIDPYAGGSGVHTLTARANTAQGAALLANLAAQSLLDWDRGRAVENVRRAAAGYRAQLAQLDEQIGRASGVERQTLIARRATLQTNLASVLILEDSTMGSLSRLSSAVAPLTPDAPRPLRNALLVSLLSGLIGLGLLSMLSVTDRAVRGEDDLLVMNLPTLATIPRLRQRDIVFSGIVRAARQAGLYEAIGFLRVNLMTALQGKDRPIILITSTAPGEGKSSLAATLGDGFAASGQRVLIVDADLRRGTQEAVWKKFNDGGQWHQLCGTGGVRTTQEALLSPDNVQVLQVEPNVDMLPAGPSLHDTLSLLNRADIGRALQLWRAQYDVVLIDSAPLLALADGLVIGTHADAVVMVTEYGRTNLAAVRNALRRAERGGLKVLGAVVNKVNAREEQSYGYGYAYTAAPKQKS
ncbi:polysaccharide biosynthesis tyrosine autokinase [Deinococcus arcticus]|uniref:Succinoglycan biosynthesis protein exop n=1 Tax=Deinococcus arcticus TaxID=2136176 RepID=A0A2T3W5G8_9DEIO|nr:CpsD/CapB family tyrosine-protein kinase [Deinococcus arcticus]PTA67140.1 succinoglycan biosynthesis protein exop [Deinococcus arcticus]